MCPSSRTPGRSLPASCSLDFWRALLQILFIPLEKVFFSFPCLCALSNNQPALISLEVPEGCASGQSQLESLGRSLHSVSAGSVCYQDTSALDPMNSISVNLTVERRQSWIQPRVEPGRTLSVMDALQYCVLLWRNSGSQGLQLEKCSTKFYHVPSCNCYTKTRLSQKLSDTTQSMVNDPKHTYINVLELSLKRKPKLFIYFRIPKEIS